MLSMLIITRKIFLASSLLIRKIPLQQLDTWSPPSTIHFLNCSVPVYTDKVSGLQIYTLLANNFIQQNSVIICHFFCLSSCGLKSFPNLLGSATFHPILYRGVVSCICNSVCFSYHSLAALSRISNLVKNFKKFAYIKIYSVL